MNQLALVALRGRTIGWISPLDGNVVASTGVADRRGTSSITDALNLDFRGGSRSAGRPTRSRPRPTVPCSRTRFSLLGATGAALQLGFCLAAAVGMRTW